MKTISNEQKAKEIAESVGADMYYETPFKRYLKEDVLNAALQAMEWKDAEWRKVLDRVLRAWQANKSFNDFEEFLIKNFGYEQPTAN